MSEVDELTPAAARSARLLARVLPVAAALAAIAFLMFSAAEFERIKAYMDALSFDGDAFTFSRPLFATLVRAARVTAAALAGAAVVLFRSRGRVERHLGRLEALTVGYVSRTLRAGVAAIRAETAAHTAVVVGAIALGGALRIRVVSQPINYDESFTFIVYVNRPWLITWANYSEPNNHLFHTFLAHLSTAVFGNAVWALRLPALVAGILTIPLAYVVARRLAGRDEALIVAALTATAPILIAYSVCARGYTMLLDFFLLAVGCGLDLIAWRSTQPWPIFVICCTLAFFTLPTFIYPFGALLIWLYLAGRRDPSNPALRVPVIARATTWTVALTALCYAPAMATSGLQAGINYSRGIEPAMAFLTTVWRPLRGIWRDFMRSLPRAMVAAVAVSAALGMVRLWRTVGGWTLLVPLLALPALTVPVQRTLAPTRVWIYLLPIIFIYAAAGSMAAIGWIGSRRLHAGPSLASATAAALALAIALRGTTDLPPRYNEWNTSYETYTSTDLEEVAGYLKTSLASRDALVVGALLDYPLEYYLRIHQVPIASLRRPPTRPARVILLANDSAGQPVERVLKNNGYDATRTNVRLVRRFTYSAVYELEPPRAEP
jgi:4-amino-4-deoxy-L-arabinose transferase-like glycosyltransferase